MGSSCTTQVEMISNIETTGITDKRDGDPVIQREGDNVVSAKNVMIPQIYCHIPGSWPSDQYCESYKVANRGSSGENGIGIVSSEVVSLPSEVWIICCIAFLYLTSLGASILLLCFHLRIC